MYLLDMPIDGRSERLLLEVSDVDEGLVDVARPGQVVARGARSLQEMLRAVRPVADSFVTTFSGLTHAPDEISVSFGVALNAETDAIITSVSAAANFSVSLTWRPSHSGGNGRQAPVSDEAPEAPGSGAAPAPDSDAEDAGSATVR
ncbi:CU044_2847 family protein [Streptomyces sp. CA2R106]|uniref:CU044_2847 family protein n=1 Tax=Streptomyces sp. CA2R106 TaxID=3120153 RepID=UPI00300B2844